MMLILDKQKAGLNCSFTKSFAKLNRKVLAKFLTLVVTLYTSSQESLLIMTTTAPYEAEYIAPLGNRVTVIPRCGLPVICSPPHAAHAAMLMAAGENCPMAFMLRC